MYIYIYIYIYLIATFISLYPYVLFNSFVISKRKKIKQKNKNEQKKH